MGAIAFTSAASSIAGANGKLYFFFLGNLNIYKIEQVTVFRDSSTDSWVASRKGSYEEIYKLLSTTDTIPSTDVFSYFFADNVLYMFVATAVENSNNKIIVKRKRGFKRVFVDSDAFDVYDNYIVALADYAEQIYASMSGQRVSKYTQKRIDDFELSLSNKTFPV